MGGGLSGLFTASELVTSGVEDVVVLEAGARPGGIVRTVERAGFSLEPGAGSFSLPHPHLGPILARAGAEVIPARGARWLYVDRRLVPLAATPRLLFEPFLGPISKLRALCEVFVSAGDDMDEESLEVFCRRRFGSGAGELLAWLMASGVFGGDPKRISVSAAFPALVDLERQSRSLIRGALRRRRATRGGRRPVPHVPVGGMSAVVDSVTRSLGDRVITGCTVDVIRAGGSGWVVDGSERIDADVVVLAVRPERAASLVDAELAGVMRRAVSAPVAVVGLGGSDAELPEGFGALIGPREGLVSVGVLFESSYAPSRAPAGSWMLKVIAGGATRPEVAGWNDDELVAAVTAESGRVVGVDLEPSYIDVLRHDPGIPQYDLGHARWLAALDGLVRTRPGMHLTGWGYRGVGVGSVASDAVRVARAVTA